MAEPAPGDTLRLAREQGYREGYTRALADVQLHLSSAIHAAYDGADPKTYVTALQHARAIVAGLRGRAKRKEVERG